MSNQESGKLNMVLGLEVLACFVLLCVLLYTVQFTTLHFDGAMNYQISQNLALSGEYRSSYVDYGYNGLTETLFDHKIQTSGSVMLVATIFNWVLGCNPINMQYATVLHLFVLAVALYIILKQNLGRVPSFLVCLYVVFITVQNAYNGYGELAVALFIFLSIVVFTDALTIKSNAMCFLAGIILGIGYLTKTVCLIAVPAFVISFVSDFLMTKKIKTIIPYIILAVGMLVPVIAFELFKLFVMGLETYVYWWGIEFANILSESGASDGLGSSLSGIAKWQNNFEVYLSTYMVSGFFLGIMIAAVPVSSLIMRKHNSGIEKSVWILYFVGLIYVIWWIFIVPAPRLWWRRAIIGHIFLVICVAVCVGKFICLLQGKYRYIMNGIVSMVVLLALASQIPNSSQYFRDEIKNRESIRECVNYMKTLPDDAVFFGRDWWQNPQIAAEANCEMLNITDYPDFYGDAYYIADHSTTLLAADSIIETLEDYNGELVFQSNNNSIYKLSQNYPDEVSSSLGQCNVLSGYHDDGWVGINACFTVRSAGEGTVLIKGYYPFEITGNEQLNVLYNGELAAEYTVKESSFEIAFACEPNGVGVLKIETNFARNGTPPDTRILSFILSEIQVR